MVLATIGLVGAAVAPVAELFGDSSTVLVGALAGVATRVVTLFVADAVVSMLGAEQDDTRR